MQINDAGLALVKEREGYHTALPDDRCTTYYCPANVLTIGWGCTEGIKPGDIWTKAQAEAALRRELAKHEAAVTRLVSVDLNENQFSALVSFSYNVGYGPKGLGGSTLLKKLNKGDYPGAQKHFMDYTKHKKAGKLVHSRGLAVRRAKEAALFALPTAEEDQERGTEIAMPQAVAPPVEPVGNVTKIATAGTIGAGGAEAAKSFLGGPPPAVNDAVQSVGAWQSIAKSIGGIGDLIWSNPIATIAIAALVLGATMLIPNSWGAKS